MTEEDDKFLVIAKYNFDGKNNDELSFRKNDIISVIQKLEGGWWEGSLDAKIGWFPSNFVGIVQTESRPHTNGKTASENVEKQRVAYRIEIIENFLQCECKHVQLIDMICTQYLRCLEDSDLLSQSEMLVIRSNISEILDLTRQMYLSCESENKKPLAQQRFGQIFLDAASNFYPLMKLYCENHCIAVELINVKRDIFEGLLTDKNLELNLLISALSSIYKHIEKYSITLQEIERTISESHSDRGNLQRAHNVYRELYEYCEFVRRQKEGQMEFLASGALVSFGDEWTNILGSFIHISKVAVSAVDATTVSPIALEDAIIRCITVFTKSILLFDTITSTKGFNYILKNRISCEDLIITKENKLFLLCLRKTSKNLLVMKSLTNGDYRRLCAALGECIGVVFERESLIPEMSDSTSLGKVELEGSAVAENLYVNQQSLASTNVDTVDAGLIPGSGGFLRRNRRGGSVRAIKKNEVAKMTNGLVVNHELEMIMPEGLLDDPSPTSNSPHIGELAVGQPQARHRAPGVQPPYSGWCLRPLPAPRGEYFPGSSVIKMRKGLSPQEQDDAQMLKVVEGYCTGSMSMSASQHNCHYPHHLYHYGGNTSATIGHLSPLSSSGSRHVSGILAGPVRRAASYPDDVVVDLAVHARPQLIVAENEKIFVEEMVGNQIVLKERSLVDTVYALKDQLLELQKEVGLLSKNFEMEQKARRRFEDLMHRSSGHLSHSTTSKAV